MERGGPTLLPFLEAVRGPKSTLPHPPGWPQAQQLLHPKGIKAGQLSPRLAVSDKAASLPAAPHSWENLHLKEALDCHRLTQSCSASAASSQGATAIIRTPSAASGHASLGLAGGTEHGCWAYFESELIPILVQ